MSKRQTKRASSKRSRKTGAPQSGDGLSWALGEFVAGLEESARPNMIIGGVAVIARGIPQITRDVDGTVAGDRTDLRALLGVLERRSIVPRIERAAAFAEANHVLLLRHDPSGVDIDLSLAWLPFELEAIAAAEVVTLRGARVRLPRPEDLVIYKVVAWRPQDQQDVERLIALHGGRMDLDRVRRFAREVAAMLDEPDRVDEVERLIQRSYRER